MERKLTFYFRNKHCHKLLWHSILTVVWPIYLSTLILDWYYLKRRYSKLSWMTYITIYLRAFVWCLMIKFLFTKLNDLNANFSLKYYICDDYIYVYDEVSRPSVFAMRLLLMFRWSTDPAIGHTDQDDDDDVQNHGVQCWLWWSDD